MFETTSVLAISSRGDLSNVVVVWHARALMRVHRRSSVICACTHARASAHVRVTSYTCVLYLHPGPRRYLCLLHDRLRDRWILMVPIAGYLWSFADTYDSSTINHMLVEAIIRILFTSIPKLVNEIDLSVVQYNVSSQKPMPSMVECVYHNIWVFWDFFEEA